jgi:hypothetical protein
LYGIINKDQKPSEKLLPKQCPNCNEPNKIDSKFCSKCRMVLTYNEYVETLEKQTEKENEIKDIRCQLASIQKQLNSFFIGVANTKDQDQINKTAKLLYDTGILKQS